MQLKTRNQLAAAVLAVTVSFTGLAQAGVIGVYTFSGTDPAGDLLTPNNQSPATAAPNSSFTSFTRTGIAQISAADAYRSNNYSAAGSIDTGQYAQFTVTADAGYALELSSISFNATRIDKSPGQRGPLNGAVRSSFESYAAGSGTGSTYATTATTLTASPNWDFNDYASGSAGSASFRFYGWNSGSHAEASQELDNVTLNGDVVSLAKMQASAPAPATPVIVGATSGVNVSVNNTAAGGTKQQNLSYTVSGTGDLSGGGSNTAKAPGGAADVVVLTIDTSTAGAQSGNVVISSNAYSTNGTVGSSFNQAVNVDVLDHSEGSFDADTNLDSIDVDFGTVTQGSTASIGATLFNLIQTSGYTAGLNLYGINETDPDAVFSTNLSTITNLAAGGSSMFAVDLDTSLLGTFTGTYSLLVRDQQDLAGATNGQTLTINTFGNVVPVPEPASIGLLLGAAGLLLRRRRR